MEMEDTFSSSSFSSLHSSYSWNTNSTRIRQQMQRQRFSDTQSMGQPWSCVLANTGTAV